MKPTLGFAITGSHCTFERILAEIKQLIKAGYTIKPIFSYATAKTDTRFFKAADFRAEVIKLTGCEPIDTIVQAEGVSKQGFADAMVVAPCTGNTLAKIANAVTDTPVTMAVKAHLRNNLPVVIAISSNDLLGVNFKNLGVLMNAKNVFFVPFGQDNPSVKTNSLVADMSQIALTVEHALQNKQLQPVLLK